MSISTQETAPCWKCKENTRYRCLKCNGAVCNRSLNCYVAASEETPGWKAGYSVAFCVSCCEGSNNNKHEGEQAELCTPTTSSDECKISSSKPSSTGPSSKKRKKSVKSFRFCLPMDKRVEIIHFAAKNPSFGYRKIASAFSVGRTQVKSIIKKKEEILTAYQSNLSKGQKQKGQRTGKFSDVNQALWDWYTLCRSSNIPVSGTMLQEEALLIAEKLGIEGFAASNGWLESFKKTQNISTMSVAGEEGDVSSLKLESWKERSRELVRGWKPENIWNIDETGCFWKGLPEVSLNKKGSRCSGGKQRNTWASFVNAAGGKEDPIVIGQSERPRCFKALKDDSRPYKCHYFANKKAWMNSDLMTDILTSLNRRLQLKQRKIMLFMDNAPCHPADLQDKLSNINIVFLPKNTTSKTQPLDSGIIASWKCRYKKRLLRHVCSKVDGSNSASDIVKSVNLLMSIEWGRQAWDDVSRETIVKCFKRTGLYPDEVDEEDDPFEGEEVSGLQELVTALNGSILYCRRVFSG